MTVHTRRHTLIDPQSVRFHFSDKLRGALGDLAASVHFSETFDSGTLETLREWSTGGNPTALVFASALADIAEDTMRHIHTTGDERAQEAWDSVKNELLERGFALEKTRSRAK